MLNKEATRFLKRKSVKSILADKVLTGMHYAKLNRLFNKFRCKELENMHTTIAKFVLYDLNNYEGRLRRLAGIPGTSEYTQLLRYGKHQFREVLHSQAKRKTLHFANTIEHWIAKGMTEIEAAKKVIECQKSRSARSPSAQKGANEYSPRCVGFWIKQGLSEEQAKIEVGKIQRRQHTNERNDRWQATLNSKSDAEKELINKKKGHSIDAYILRGLSLSDAIAASTNYYAKRNNYSKSSQVFFGLLEMAVGHSDVYYKVKNYEKQFSGKCVDFYDARAEVVVEYYGDFWHRNPNRYASDFVAYNKSSSQIWLEDNIRVSRIISAGVNKVIIVWESEVLSNPQECVNKILGEINGNQRSYSERVKRVI